MYVRYWSPVSGGEGVRGRGLVRLARLQFLKCPSEVGGCRGGPLVLQQQLAERITGLSNIITHPKSLERGDRQLVAAYRLCDLAHRRPETRPGQLDAGGLGDILEFLGQSLGFRQSLLSVGECALGGKRAAQLGERAFAARIVAGPLPDAQALLEVGNRFVDFSTRQQGDADARMGPA